MHKWILFCLALFGLVACKQGVPEDSGKKGPGKGDRALAVSAVIAHETGNQSQVRGLATVLPGEMVELKTEIAGKIAQVLFREGAFVEQGALLLKLGDSELQASAAKAKARYEYLQLSQTRKKQQFELQAISQQDLDLSNADLAAAKADLDLILAQLAKTELRAPFAGVLGLRRISEGAVIPSGQVISTLTQTHPVKLEFAVQGNQVDLVRIGAVVDFVAQGVAGTAKIYASEGRLTEGTRSMLVRALVNGKNGNLVPGSTLAYSLTGKEQRGFMIPPDALAGNEKGAIVYRLQKGKASPVPVIVGARTAESIVITQGLQEGDTVLCVGASSVRPGMKVEILELR